MKLLFKLSIEGIKKYFREAVMVVVSITLTISMMMVVSITMGSVYQSYASFVSTDTEEINASVYGVKNVSKFLDALGREDLKYWSTYGDLPNYEIESEQISIRASSFPIYKLDADNERMFNQTILEGRLPENSFEITIPQTSSYKVGDVIEVTSNEAVFEVQVVGMTRSEYDYEYFVDEKDMVDHELGFTMDILFVEGTKDVDKLLKEVVEDPEIFLNHYMLHLRSDYNFVMGYQSTPGPMLYAFMVATFVLLIIVAAATFTLIMNSFDAFLSTKKETLSTLRSVGATKGQIRVMILFEGFILSTLGIVVGLCMGYFISQKLLNFLSINVIEIASALESEFTFEMAFWGPLWTYFLVIIVGYAMIYLVLRSKLKSLFILQIIETVRILDMKKTESHLTLNPKPMKNLARINTLKLKDYQGIKIALTVIIVLLISINGWVGIVMETTDQSTTRFDTVINGYQFSAENDIFETNQLVLNKLAEFEEVIEQEVFYVSEPLYIVEDKSLEYLPSLTLSVIEDNTFKQFKETHNLSKDNQFIFYVYDDHLKNTYKDIEFKPGFKLSLQRDISDSTEFEIEFDEVLEMIDPKYSYILYSYDTILIDQATYNAMFSTIDLSYSSIKLNTDFKIDDLDHIVEFLEGETFEGFYLSSEYYTSYVKTMLKRMVSIVTAFTFAYIGLVVLVNIVNISISNYRKRKRDFAMIRSMGATSSQMNKMLLWESIYVVIKPLILGIILGNLLTLGLNLLLNFLIPDFSFVYQLNLFSILLAVILVVLIVITQLIALRYESRKSEIMSDIRSY